MSNNLFESLRFRVHVRNLLYDYVKKHCTIDYVTFTEAIVSEFFEDVQLVPLTDPYSLTLPTDPLDTLEKIYSELPSYSPDDHDVMEIPQETVACVKQAFKVRAGKCKTERVVMNNSYGTSPPQEPFYPALTRRARQSTKKLGSRVVRQPSNLKDLLAEHKLAVLEVETVEEPKGELEDTLKIQISIEPGEQPAVKSLLQSTLETLRTGKPYTNRYLDSTFLCNQFPVEPSYTPPEDVFMPIFPRRRHIGISAPATGVELANFKNLIENASAPFEPVDVANFDKDIPRQNIVLVGGWQAIESSPPSSKASGNDELDELDDIRFPSSPCTTPPLVQELENSKMDLILIPRSRRIGGNDGITPHILHGKTLKTFLTPLLTQARTEREGPQAGAERIPSPTPSSLIGQPPSALGIDHDIETEDYRFPDFDVDLEIQKVCEGYDLEPDFFLDETIDDRAAILMEVPTLPQPNEFPKDFHIPKSLSDLVIPSAVKGGQNQPNIDLPLPPFRFLKKVKGCQSLSLQLSWVLLFDSPFTIDKHPPTVFEILDVVDLFPLEGPDYKQALGLLESVGEEPSHSKAVPDVSIRRGLEEGPEDPIYTVPTEKFLIMLNKKERDRVDRLDGPTLARGRDNFGSGTGDLDFRKDGNPLAEFQTCLPTNDIDMIDAGGRSDLSDVNADFDRPWKKPRSSAEELLLDDVSPPVEFADSRPAAGEGLDLPENRHTIWPGYSTPTSQSDEFNCDQNLVQEYASDVSLESLPYACPDGTRHSDYHPDYLDSRVEAFQDTGDEISTSLVSSGRHFSGVLADFDISSKPELSRHSLGSFAFAQLRARKVSAPRIEPAHVENLVTSPGVVESIELHRGPPPEVCDANTIYLESIIPQSIHKYMASLELLQRQALVRALRSRNCAVELVDRRDLAGVDLILDTDTAVIFINLFSLPLRCDSCMDKIVKGSWKFDRLLIVFEAFGELSAKMAKQRHPSLPTSRATVGYSSEPHAYTPPIVKALKKFKRDLCITEACGTKRAATIVQYGFADTVEEAALFTRLYGDWCEANDRTHGAIWGTRDWLDADFLEDDEDQLASLKGFNHFSASIVLCQMSLAEFVDLCPEERVSDFGAYILPDHIRMCNEDLDARLVAMQTEQDSEVEVEDFGQRSRSAKGST